MMSLQEEILQYGQRARVAARLLAQLDAGQKNAGLLAMIGKLPAPIAHWDDNLIECYVPEGAALGKSQVVVRPRQGLP